MRILRVLPFFTIVLLMTACVPSLYPLYTERDQVFDPGLVGVWVAVDDGHETIWTVTKSGDGYEMVDVEEDEDPAKFEVRLVKLGGQTFLDLFPAPQEPNNGLYRLHVIRAHTFMKVTLDGDNLGVMMLDQDWLKNALKAGDSPLAHQKLADGDLLLTAPTPDLQDFILKSCADPDAFGEPMIFTRREQ